MSSHALDRTSARDMLGRLLDAPDFPQVIARLEPEILHGLVEECGLEACAEIVAMATPGQLMQVFDLDLWRSSRPGVDPHFDAARFGEWLAVLVESGPALAAEKLEGLDFDLVTAAIIDQFLVLDRTWSLTPFHPLAGSRPFEIGPYQLFAWHGGATEAFLTVLRTLEAERPDFFVPLMDKCCRISVDHVDDNDSLYEVATASEHVLAEMASDRDQRREQKGFVTPAQAAAFLLASRRVRLTGRTAPARDPISVGYFRTIERLAGTSGQVRPSTAMARGEELRALPGVDGTTRLSLITAQMQLLAGRDEAAYVSRIEELGYLANALAAGCGFASRPLTAAEAYEIALATANLGLENWPRRWLTADRPADASTPLPDDFLSTQDLVPVFQVGWTTLHRNVALYAVRRLREALLSLTCHDDVVQQDIVELCDWLTKYRLAGTPWRVRDRLDVVAILDTPTWALLLNLVEQCPATPKNIAPEGKGRPALRVSTEFEFISENHQIAWARQFLESLIERLAS